MNRSKQAFCEPTPLWRQGMLMMWAGAIVFGIMCGPMVDRAGADDLKEGLLGHWAFDGNVSDSSGSGHDGKAHGDPGFAEGKIGKAIKLDGKGQYVEIGKHAADVTQLTLVVWMHIEGMPSPDNLSSIYHNNGWEDGDVHLPYAGPEGVMDLGIKGNEPSMSVPEFKVKDLQKRWVHLVVTYDAEEGKDVRFYVDGKRTDDFKIEKANPVRLGPGRIGTWDVEGRWYNGLLDEFYIYERELSDADVKALHELTGKK